MKHMTVLISGASVAGPALAFWLARSGCTVTVVERAPALRTGGQAVDFKGETHRTVLQRMGILDEVRARQTGGHDQGRVVLLGDSAYGNTLGGFGTGLAIVGAYVLAGELRAAGGEHRAAFAAYESAFRGYAKVARQGNAGPFLAPATRPRMAMRNWTFRSPWMLRMMLKLTDKFATSIDLPVYP